MGGRVRPSCILLSDGVTQCGRSWDIWCFLVYLCWRCKPSGTPRNVSSKSTGVHCCTKKEPQNALIFFLSLRASWSARSGCWWLLWHLDLLFCKTGCRFVGTQEDGSCRICWRCKRLHWGKISAATAIRDWWTATCFFGHLSRAPCRRCNDFCMARLRDLPSEASSRSQIQDHVYIPCIFFFPPLLNACVSRFEWNDQWG